MMLLKAEAYFGRIDMDLTARIVQLMLLAAAFSSGVKSSQIYLQPERTEYGYFTNDNFFITCYTTDESKPQLTWIGNDNEPITDTVGRIHVQPASGGGLGLVVEKVEVNDAGQYVCSDVHNSISFNLIVYRSISFGDTPKVQHAQEGENAVIKCHVKSEPKPVVTWNLNGSKLENGPKYTIEEDSHELIIHNISRSDAGYYKCIVFVIAYLSTQTNEYDILVQVEYSPEWNVDLKNETYASLESVANITCKANGQPAPVFRWFQDDEEIHDGPEYKIFSSKNESTLQVKVNSVSQFRMYTCEASNKHGSKERNFALKEGAAPVAPIISVIREHEGKVFLSIRMPDSYDDKMKIFGYKVKYALKSDPENSTEFQHFNVNVEGEYALKNMSYNSNYVIQVAAHNAAGHGEYSEEITHETQALQNAPVVHDESSSAGSIEAMAFLLFSTFLVCM